MSTAPLSHEESIWAEVEVVKGLMASVYRGRIAKADLERWRMGDDGGTIAIHDAYWSTDDDGETWVVAGQHAGDYASAEGVVIARASAVVVVLPLMDGSEYAELVDAIPLATVRAIHG